jgi:DHA1 family multidrug resistance protein-like MFS transporter
VINKHLSVLLVCLFVVMIGLGITMPVLPFYVERLALAEHFSRQSIVMHVGLLAGVYSLGQLVFALVWGACQTERAGERSF